MAASDGIKQYWTILVKKPELIVFDYLTAQRIWQRYCVAKGAVRFQGKPTYIAFMQAFMMDGVKGTTLVSYLGELYKAGSDPAATVGGVARAAGTSGLTGIQQYASQIRALEKADLSDTWLQNALWQCDPIMRDMAQGNDIGPDYLE